MSTTISKSDIVDAIAAEAGLSKKDAEKVFGTVITTITGALKKRNKVSIIGFGTLKCKERAEREGRNPKTGEKMKIKASTSVSFVAGKPLKDAIQGEGK